MSEDSQQLSPMLLRKRVGLTQVEIAIRLGKSPSTVAKWEARDFVPKGTPAEIKKLCDVYQCTLDELIEAFEGKESAQSGDNALTS